MFKSKEKNSDTENHEKHEIIKKLRRENRRYEGMILLGALQVSALVLCYYLGRSAKK